MCDTAVAVETPSPLSAAPLDTRLEARLETGLELVVAAAPLDTRLEARLETGLELVMAAALLEAGAETDEPADWTDWTVEVADEEEAVVSALGDAVDTALSFPRLRLEFSSLDGRTVVTTVKIPSVIAV